MIDIHSRKDQHLAVFGLGASGLAAARALAASGANVEAWDDNSDQRKNASDLGIRLTNPSDMEFRRIDALVLAPGIPLTHKPHAIVEQARAAGRPIIGDIELLIEACPQARFIGITGTNGKSTTTSLLGHILAQAGLAPQIGGNLGPPALAFKPPEPGGLMVLELSSYQLDLTDHATFDIAVLLNLSPDHLDRHGDMDGYIAAKRRIFRERPDDRTTRTAIIGVDDRLSSAVRDDLAGIGHWTVISVSGKQALDSGAYVTNGMLFDAIDSDAELVCDLSSIATLPGSHNWQNAAAAYAAARCLGVPRDCIADALATYPGLPHRAELVATIGAVRYINDSKATNVDAAARAIASYKAIYWIAGGQAKDKNLNAIIPFAAHIRHAFLIGDAEDSFATALDGIVPYTRCGDLTSALSASHGMAQHTGGEDAVVLLSPACASFDQWKNFEARGDAFRALVQKLAAEATA
ncbi:MAG: UDP-N-acetylmuramoyl-L-alanine--D-glutamate ligase [Proteobacteria bacterium]|nr:UDP-N-acetylmuramoyl-L-alanine--D-glutamate ligase [Pseudomonadota bacterium]